MKLFVYDHCPFCVKARMIFGLKNVPFELVIMLNDDEATPIRMIGKKMAPILEDGTRHLAESMDIVAQIDGASGARILSGPGNPSLAQWNDDASGPLYSLALPRWAAADFKEFSTPRFRWGWMALPRPAALRSAPVPSGTDAPRCRLPAPFQSVHPHPR
jgi:glutaredoxin 2